MPADRTDVAILPVQDAETERLAERLRALGHPVRLAIVRALAEQECCCGDVCRTLPLAQSTISQHLKVLRDAGLLTYGRDGVRSCYGLDPKGFEEVRRAVEEFGVVIDASRSCRGGEGS